MSLPEDEQRRLREIERALYRDDPEFVRLMRASDPRVQYERKLRHSLLADTIGAGLLVAGAATHLTCLEAAGVVIVLPSLAWAVVSWRRYAAGVRPARSGVPAETAKGAKRRPGQTRRTRMMQRMEERWRRRQEGNGGMPRHPRN